MPAMSLTVPPRRRQDSLDELEAERALRQAGIDLLNLKVSAFNVWTPGQAWYAWCSTTGATVTMDDQAWAAWNVSVTSTAGSLAYSYAANAAYVHNGTTWVTWNLTRQETDDERAARVAELEAANRRAQDLLLSLLNEEQRRTYAEHGWFEVRGSRGGRWRIRNKGQSGNVDLMPEIGEERDATFCAHPPGSLPNADAHLAQMLTLVTDEDSFRRTANMHYRRPGWAEERAA